jgi:hypothetical protein
MLIKCLSHLHMRDTPICIFFTDSVMEMVGMLQQNISSVFQINEFHNETCFTVYTKLWETSSLPWENAECRWQWCDSDVDVSVLFSRANIQLHIEFLQRMIFHDHRYGRFCTVTIFTPSTSKKVQHLLPEDHVNHVHNFVDGWKDNDSLQIALSFQTRHHDSITNTRHLHSRWHDNPHGVVQSSFQYR